MKRYLHRAVVGDLEDEKMVFLSGPRQVGKTTLAKLVTEEIDPENGVYLNWDRPEHRKIIRSLDWSRTGRLVVLDEVHKYARWKTLLKGFYDTEGHQQRILVTGSARMDLYRKGGDSLAGRYRQLRLHPLSLGELAREGGEPEQRLLDDPASWSLTAPAPSDLLPALEVLGGFPEPFLQGSERKARRWRLALREQVLRQDLRDLRRVMEVSLVEQLVDLLAERVASPLSVNALREDLGVHHRTLSQWIAALEALHLVFLVRPYQGSLARTLRKPPKLYFWNWAEVPGDGARFENLVAAHLLKYCHWQHDVQGIRCELRYLRDRQGHEVDFLLLREGKPWILIETKRSGTTASRNLAYFQQRLPVSHAWQVTAGDEQRRLVIPARRLLKVLP